MKKLTLSLALIASLFVSGCFSSKPEQHNLNITAAYSFEGRYSSSDLIEINGNKASFNECDFIWILSNNTLYDLLTSVSDSPDKIVFGDGKVYNFSREGISQSVIKDAFDEEEYVWEKWTIPTNGVR